MLQFVLPCICVICVKMYPEYEIKMMVSYYLEQIPLDLCLTLSIALWLLIENVSPHCVFSQNQNQFPQRTANLSWVQLPR